MLLKNRRTNELRDFGNWMTPEQRSIWNYRKRCQDFDRHVSRLGLFYSFLSLTQTDLSLDTGFRWITQVMNEMQKVFRKIGFPFGYLAALEIQPKRYATYGRLASHWHVVPAYSPQFAMPHTVYHPELPSGRRYEKIRDGSVIGFDWLEKHWRQKMGQYFCCDGYSRNITDYLGKYIGKEDSLLAELKKRLGRRVRTFSSSRIPLEDQLNWFHRSEFDKELSEHPDLENLYWRREGSSIVGRAKEVTSYIDFNGVEREKVRYPRVRVIRGEWVQCETSPQDGEDIQVGEIAKDVPF